jgi:glycosyltransferase involved in cell wall biosynthesis
MRAVHVLRKYNPAEWGGTETAVLQLTSGLREHGVESTIFCPELLEPAKTDPLAAVGNQIKRYRAFVPVAGISEEQRAQLISVGGNLMSVDLLWYLFREPASIIHTHALNRIGGIALTAARFRKLPFVVTIHGGVLDMPQKVKDQLAEPLKGGVEWGKVLGAPLRSRRVLPEADAILTCNKKEAALLAEKYPGKRIVVQPHGVPMARFEQDCRSVAQAAFPELRALPYLLVLGRIDPVKNQGWVLQEFPEIARQRPNSRLVFVGACTDEQYGKSLKKDARRLGIEDRVTFAGGIAPGDPRLIGLLQGATAVVVPSHSETFGLVILEAWAAQRAVISSRTSGALDLVEEGVNGHLFDLNDAKTFHAAIDRCLNDANHAREIGCNGFKRAQEFDTVRLAGRVRDLYEDLLKEKRK